MFKDDDAPNNQLKSFSIDMNDSELALD